MNFIKKIFKKKRNPVLVTLQIEEELPEELAEQLRWKADFWAPEIFWSNLSAFINENVKPDSKNEQSVRIYALLCDKSEEEMRKEFIEQGY